MVIFSTNKKNTEKCGKNCLQKDDDGKKTFAEDNFSFPPPPQPSRKIMVRPLWVPHISMSYYDSTDKRISHDTRNNEYRFYCCHCYVICFVHSGEGSVFVSSLKNKTKQLFHSLNNTELC